MSGTVGPRPESIFNRFSFEFDGVDDYIDITSIGLSLGSDWSVSCWVKTNNKTADGGSFRGWFSTGGWNTAGNFKIAIKDNNGFASVWEGGSQVIVGNSDISDNNWHNIVLTKTTSNITLFVDGLQQSTVSNSETWSFNNIYIGAGGQSTGITVAGMWNGNIDEVSIFNTELSASHITSIYNGGVPNDISSLSPISWWRMGEAANYSGGQWTLVDQGSGGNDGTSNGMDENNRVLDNP